MKVTIKKFDVDWLEIKNNCRETINMNDSSFEPTDKWKKELLIARHSPLRDSTILIELEDIPYYVHTHLVRHNVGVTPFVGTSREDRTGIKREDRTQTDLVSMRLLVNIESLINISEKRLCNCADIETIKVWREVLKAIKKYDENIYWANAPQCINKGGCPEVFNTQCKFYENLMKDATKEEQMSLIKRYDIYNNKRGTNE